MQITGRPAAFNACQSHVDVGTAFQTDPGRVRGVGSYERDQSPKLGWNIRFCHDTPTAIQNTNGNLPKRRHLRRRIGPRPSPGVSYNAKPGWHSSRAESSRADYPMCGNGATAEPLRHRQTKGAETDMLSLTSLRHTSTLPTRALSSHRGGSPRPEGFLSEDAERAAGCEIVPDVERVCHANGRRRLFRR